jgi:hypothetical protein
VGPIDAAPPVRKPAADMFLSTAVGQLLSSRAQDPAPAPQHAGGMSGNPIQQQNTGAFYTQAVASFILSSVAVTIGIFYLDVDAWQRGFLGLGMLYAMTSAFTLAKVIRDKQEVTQVVSRVDQARLDKLLTEHDLYRTDA